jgi:tRNA G18 (ribose-2'-O)-methylase SpoU
VAVHALTVTPVITPVTALDDPRLDDYRDIREDRLRARGLFAVETREVVRRLLHEGRFPLRSILVTEPTLDALRDVLAPPTVVYVATKELIHGVVGLNFHRGCMAIGVRGVPVPFDDILASPSLILCERLTNPDNVGGVFRNAMAFGAGGVVLSPGSADPLYRKVVRVSIGGSVSVPLVETPEWPDAIERVRAAGYTVVALTTRDGTDIATIARPAKLALLLGSEGDGLTDAALAHADVRATIPMAPGVDSLNANVACGIALDRLATTR